MEFSDPNMALNYLKHNANFTNMAVFLDIDDTLLFYRDHAIYVVPHMFAFYQHLLAEGAKIYMITARPYSAENMDRTLKHLQFCGYKNFEALFLMKLSENEKPTSHNISLYKSTVRGAIRDSLGVESVLAVGNEWYDLVLPQYLGVSLNPESTYLFNAIGENITFLLKLPTKVM
jgi:hypothetical protein